MARPWHTAACMRFSYLRSSRLRALCRLLCISVAAIHGIAAADSVLVPPPLDASVYDKPWSALNVAQRRKLSLYGLRFAPLDPRVWGLRVIDVTESKILIPIRPFFLRASDSAEFRLESIEVLFEFKKVPPALMEKHPREHDPVFEIGFAGAYSSAPPGAPAAQDRGFAARLSAFPAIPSGFYERARDRYETLGECSQRTLDTGRDYSARLQFSDDEVSLSVDGAPCAVLRKKNLGLGLVSFQTSWSPVLFKKVAIRARSGPGITPAQVLPSGIIDTAVEKRAAP